jgi:hypothetical protein
MRLSTRLFALAALAIALFAWSRAEAIPAFARKYQISCSTCHAPFPRLKPYGEEFAARGFRMEDPSKEPPRDTYDVGDPLLKLVRSVPLALRLDGYASWKEDAKAEVDNEWPWAFKILSGGPITDKISYYLYFIVENSDVVGLEDAWVQFNAMGGAPLDLQVGQFQVCDPLFKRELRLERFDYEIYKTNVGETHADLTYDRGGILTWHAPAKWDVLGMVVNGNGIGEADEDDNFDQDSYKNGALRVVRPFEKFRLGLFGYYGKEKDEATGRTNETVYYGPDFIFDVSERWQVSVQYLERRDDDPFFTGTSGPKYETRGGFAEVHYMPGGADGRWFVSGLYNNVRSDDPVAEVETASITGNYLVARNFRLVLEAGRDLEADATRVSVGLVTAF